MNRPGITTWPFAIDPFQELPSGHVGLDFAYGGGRVRQGVVVNDILPGALTLADNTTNFVFVNSITAIVGSQTGSFPVGVIPLFEVTTSLGKITKTTDKRTPWMLQGEEEEGTLEIHGNELHSPNFVGSAGIIANMPEKVSLHDNDKFIIEDSQDGNNPKSFPFGNLPSGGSGMEVHGNEFHEPDFVGAPGVISALTEKISPHDNDKIIIEDSEDSNNPKHLTVGNLPSGDGGGGMEIHGNDFHDPNFTPETTFNSHTNDSDAHKGQKNSIQLDANSLQLVGDILSPGNDRYYGTGNTGTKGYHVLPGGSSDSPFSGSWENIKTGHSAAGDGVTDDSTAFQNALDAAGNGVGVFLPSGTYLVTQRLQVKSGTVVMGMGIDQTIIDSRKPSGATDNGDDNSLFITQHSGSHTENIAFLDFTAQTVDEDPSTGDRTQTAIWWNTGSGTDRPEGLRVERCKLNLFRRPLRGSSSTSGIGRFLIVRNCQILNFLAGSLARMNVERSWILYNFFDRPVEDTGDGFGRSIYIANHGRELHIVGNKMVNGAGGIHVRDSGTFQELVIAYNYVNSPPTALNNVLFVGGDPDSNRAVITGNIFIGDNGTGTSSGICARIRMHHAVVTGNVFEHHTGGGSSGSIGVAIDANDILFAGNTLRSTVSDPQVGLHCSGNRNTIQANHFEYINAVGRDIAWFVSGAVRCVVQGNTVQAPNSSSSGVFRAFSGANENVFLNNFIYSDGGLRDDGLNNAWIRNVARRDNLTIVDPINP